MVSIAVGKLKLKSIVIETPASASYLINDGNIQVLFKETEVILANADMSSTSIINSIPCQVNAIERGQLLSKVELLHLEQKITAIITTEALDYLQVKAGAEINALIKTNELMLAK